jgi:thiopurine S-methyltransferase
MGTEWHARWDEGRIGFHLPDVNGALRTYLGRLVDEPSRVLVPLAGKTLDMTFLAEQGHVAVGVELVEKAARDYFAERGITPEERHDPHLVLVGGNVELHVADMLEVAEEALGGIDAVWDRAAMVALPADVRRAYAARLLSLLPAGQRLLLVAFGYDQSRMDGPPFSVPDDEVRGHYDAAGTLELLEHATMGGPGKFAEKGIEITESVGLLERA